MVLLQTCQCILMSFIQAEPFAHVHGTHSPYFMLLTNSKKAAGYISKVCLGWHDTERQHSHARTNLLLPRFSVLAQA